MDETEIARLKDRLGRAENALRKIRRLCDEAETINPDEVRWLIDQAERP